jgi:L-2-hydroxyglutarate oxidase LhgO
VRWGDVGELIASRGFRRLARRHWRTGVAELWRDISKSAFLRELRRYMPELAAGDLLAGPSGVRAQAVDDDGGLIDDFVVDVVGRVVNVRNAPSPAATSSLAIASEIVDRVSAVV